jgi:hypothetical protein
MENESYVESASKISGKRCIETTYSELNDSRFRLSIGNATWLGKNPRYGQTNYLRRVVEVFNARDEVDTIYLDKIYLYNKTETKRSRHALMYVLNPKSTRTLYVMWDTQYDPLKDVTVAFSNKTEELGFDVQIAQTCVDDIEIYNVTKTREVRVGEREEITGYKEVVKVRLN